MRLDLDPNTEEQRPIKQSFCGSLRRDTHWKCLILSALISGCLAAIAWCRLTVVTRVVINFYEMPITQTAHSSPCDDGYIYIPVAFVVMLYLVYLVECWHSHTRIELQYKVDVNTVYERIQAMREALPVVWWRAVCYHYVRRTRQVTRYRNGDAFTTTQVYYERVNSHTARSAFNFSHCGVKDISKHLVNLETYPATKIKFSKGFSFASVGAENEFEDQRAQFFHEHERRDDYMETREGLDLLNVNFKEYMIAFADPDNLPWYVSHIVFWLASILLLSWPLRVCIEYKTAYVHYHVHKLFGCNYLDPSYCPGTMSRVSTMGSSELEMNIRNNYSLVPSYSEALLMENCYAQHQSTQDPNGNLTPSSIVNGFIPSSFTHYGTLPSLSNGTLPNGNIHLANGHAGSGAGIGGAGLAGGGHQMNGSLPSGLIMPGALANGQMLSGGLPVILNIRPGELEDEDVYLEYNSQRRHPHGKVKLQADTPGASNAEDDSNSYVGTADRCDDQVASPHVRSRVLSVTTSDLSPGSPESQIDIVLEDDHGPRTDAVDEDDAPVDGAAYDNGQRRPSPERACSPTAADSSSQVAPQPPVGTELPSPGRTQAASDDTSGRNSPMSDRTGAATPAPDGKTSCDSDRSNSLPLSASLSRLPFGGSSSSSDEQTVGMRSSQTAPPSSFKQLTSTSPPPHPPKTPPQAWHSPDDPSLRCLMPPLSPDSHPSTTSSIVSLSRHFQTPTASRGVSYIDLPLVHASPSSNSRRSSGICTRGSNHASSSSAGTSPARTPPSGTPTSQGSPRHGPSVQSPFSANLSCQSLSSCGASCQSNLSQGLPSTSGHASQSNPGSQPSSHAPSPHSSPRHASSVHTSPKHRASSSQSSGHSYSPHCSPRHAPSVHSSPKRSASPRRVLSSQSSTTSSIHSPSPHTSPRHAPSYHSSSSSSLRSTTLYNHTSNHSTPSPHSSPRRLLQQTTPPPEVPPPAYEEALTMRVVQESPVHRSTTTTTTTTVAVSDTELSETARTTTRRYTLRCMETSL